MATFGKKFSSAAAVACVWAAGSGLVELFYLGVVIAVAKICHAEGTMAAQVWFAAPSPLLAASGGTVAVWLLRRSSGWPQLPLPRLFWHALCAAVLALALLPLGHVRIVAVVASILAILGAMIVTWQEAGRHSLGTHLDPGSTIVVAEGQAPENGEGPA